MAPTSQSVSWILILHRILLSNSNTDFDIFLSNKVYQILFLNPFLINSPQKSYLFVTLLKSNFCISQSYKLFPQALSAGKWCRFFLNSHMTISSINFALSSPPILQIWLRCGSIRASENIVYIVVLVNYFEEGFCEMFRVKLGVKTSSKSFF